ncbi:AarF/UbiB family protein, partial [Legionella sp.]|uniref:AarF/UbiB family protein n=1 Tax=Legionella sp. TaxID=459 RepID=UPI003D14DA7E
MKSIKQLFRILHINYILAKNGLDNVVVSLRLFAPFRFIVYLNPWNWFRKEHLTHGQALRKSLEELGPIFIKFGQALSTRPDILPPEIALELTKLQDSVPPFPSEKAMQIIEQAYGQSPYDVFAQFDPEALASASMAQVHAATLSTGQEVIVKVLRPNMRRLIESDLSIMHTIAKWADRYWPESRRLKPREIVKEFEHTLLDELDLSREAANAAQLRRNFEGSHILYIPEIYWDYTRNNVLVMERIRGIPVSDLSTLKAQGVDVKKLAERGVEIFFTQVFRDCFFHADMHPGNIFVSHEHPKDPQYICIDFGIMGTLNDNDKRYLAENLLAFFNRDYRRVAQLHVESGWVARDTRVDEFESAIRTVCEPIFERSLKDISFAQVVL